MEDSMRAFMADNAAMEKEVEYVASKRFIGADGNPIMWRIRILPQLKFDSMRKKCRRTITNAKTGQRSVETDTDALNEMVLDKCIIYPNLNNEELQKSYNVIGSAALLKTMLLPGEYTELLQAVMEAHGFDNEMADKIKRAKN